MGIGMALNLQKHLQENKQPNLRYSNRTLSKGDSLKAIGGVAEPDYAALVKSCAIVFTMVRLILLPKLGKSNANSSFRSQMIKYLMSS
jgi:3-hydroxyisobutyrate dehydrogenase-like beta-hydroxyacid dehydrogenase